MSDAEIDAYLNQLDEPKRSTLSQLRRDILAAIPDAQQCISYGVPGFKVDGKTVAGFAAFKNHLSYLPHSGSVFRELTDELDGYEKSSGAMRFAVDTTAAGRVGQQADRRAASAGIPGATRPAPERGPVIAEKRPIPAFE